jgi:glucose-6-phosphate isomerase/transaldolase/glucose-6-phosphate isomerase
VRLAGGRNEALDRRAEEAKALGAPVLTIELADALDLGAEMFRWEYATAVAGSLLGVQPFDQPDVQSTKVATAALLDALERDGRLPPAVAGDAGPLLRAARTGDYVAMMIFGDPPAELLVAVHELRRAILQRTGLATTLGIGPRFLHSTGQLHKGGANRGIFVQILLNEPNLPIPGRTFGFAELLAAQAGGDLDALRSAGRRAVRLAGDPLDAVRALTSALAGA